MQSSCSFTASSVQLTWCGAFNSQPDPGWILAMQFIGIIAIFGLVSYWFTVMKKIMD
ncbi:MAG: hypothetical protein HOJ15_03220 [Candidatus Jacksonbacteria bacterium]|jgi:hypothetical protein|nr:hypothetical protein [Candidatus Jacksonbacteria bacterium]MBT6301409.1 hypothetical protein [Candidatus Jacksonbacteria bacterium]MBT6756806.1 hypothetical protein [Candidatus Jacksonbacteria bacterium]MBT6954729.1 hypothetical protein [Candidatus Jacksonbacteria bacterium]MBT7008237.1 hypothetical protein [Candidatus Jacksonbacteria bacterium]